VTVLECESATPPRRKTAPRRIDRDDRLVEALRRREPTAAEGLVTTYGDRAYRLAIGITNNPRDAEEVVQDAFWSAIRQIDLFRGESAFGSWFYRIVANAAYQKLRGQSGRRAEVALEEVLPAFREDGQHAAPVGNWSASANDAARQAELRLALTSAIDELPAHYRAALVLHDVAGRSTTEIADALRLSVANVKSRVHRARLFLRMRLAEYASAAALTAAARQPA
jgi:RNA polymerase sigma-70 factor, ECF subfamily